MDPTIIGAIIAALMLWSALQPAIAPRIWVCHGVNGTPPCEWISRRAWQRANEQSEDRLLSDHALGEITR